MNGPRRDGPFGVLRRVMTPRPPVRAGEVCEICSEPVPGSHSHVASISERRLLCTCRACYLLFTNEGAGARRLRAVPERVRPADHITLTERQWDELAIPVELVFVFRQSDQADIGADAAKHVVACYPSPAGATESELDLQSWQPLLDGVADDVEAVLIRRRGPDDFERLIVPIDVCYELVGIVRQHWTGLHGGEQVWQHIDDFFAGLYRRAGSTV